MRSFRRWWTCLLFFAVASHAGAQGYDLTGLWKDGPGGRVIYRIRQIGSTMYWAVDGTQVGSYANFAIGQIAGNTITGNWLDLPGSPWLGGGDISLRIDSNDRITVLTSSYGAQWLERMGSSNMQPQMPPAPIPQPPMPQPPMPQPPINQPPVTQPLNDWRDYPDLRSDLSIGGQFNYNCPPQGTLWAVYGTDTYTSDSSVCSAAVHAGLATLASGGSVTIEIRSGLGAYAASDRNGVSSFAFGPTSKSFVFLNKTSGNQSAAAASSRGGFAAALERVSTLLNLAGSYEYESAGNWRGTWTRRGASNQFTSSLIGPNGERQTIIEKVTLRGKHLHSERVQTTDGTICTLDGDLQADGRTFSGTAQCRNGPSGWWWILRPGR
jgi:hypothetical protein